MKFIRFFLFIITVLSLTCCSTSSIIVSGVTEREAYEIVVLLNSKGIPADKSPVAAAAAGGVAKEQLYNVSVPSDRITEAIGILNQAGLPRVKGTTLLDLFGAQGLVPSDIQDRIRYQEGLSEQLATTIRKMDGVIDANVQITLPAEGEEKKPLTASVYIKHRGVLDNPNSILVTKIKRLISSAIPGMTVDNVTVITDRATYADISLESSKEEMGDKQLVTIWGITLAKNSAALFRIIFYAFIILIFILICLLVWFIWKTYHLIAHEGGLRTVFHPEQYSVSDFTTQAPEEEIVVEEPRE